MMKERYPNIFNSVKENLQGLQGIVSFDIDAVTQKTYTLALNNASHKFGKYIDINELKTYWALADITQKHLGTSADESMVIAISLWNNDYVYGESPLMPGILNLLTMFNEAKIPYIFISSRPAEFLETTKKYFEKNLPFVNPENIIMTRVNPNPGGAYKAAMIDKYGVGLHIEDSFEEAKSIVGATPARVIMIPQPWNDHDRFEHARIKYLGSFVDPSVGSYPLLKFLGSLDAREFLHNVAHY